MKKSDWNFLPQRPAFVECPAVRSEDDGGYPGYPRRKRAHSASFRAVEMNDVRPLSSKNCNECGKRADVREGSNIASQRRNLDATDMLRAQSLRKRPRFAVQYCRLIGFLLSGSGKIKNIFLSSPPGGLGNDKKYFFHSGSIPIFNAIFL